MNTLYNLGGQPRFTSDDRMKTVLLAQFADAAGVFLYDGVGQFKTDNLGLGTIEKVPYWQAVGTTFDTDLAFNEASAINIKTSENNNVSASGILGVVFDRDALGVWNERQKVRTEYSAAGDFYTAHFGYRKNVWNDFNEQFCVFYVA